MGKEENRNIKADALIYMPCSLGNDKLTSKYRSEMMQLWRDRWVSSILSPVCFPPRFYKLPQNSKSNPAVVKNYQKKKGKKKGGNPYYLLEEGCFKRHPDSGPFFFVIWLLTFAHSALSETRIAMQIKARYLGQIACYTTIVLTASENLSEEPVLISFNTIYIGERKKKNQITSPTTEMKKQPMSHRLQQRYQSMQGWKRGAYRGSHGLPKTPHRALQSQGLHQIPNQERRLGCALRKGPRGITDPQSQCIQISMKKISVFPRFSVARELVGYQLPVVISTPHLQETKAQCCCLDR